jgi:GNAT superfamily N-acetyltransferase
MTTIAIEELSIPASLDAPEADDFRAANELRNIIGSEALGPEAGSHTPEETLTYIQEQQYERKRWFVARLAGQIVAYALPHWSVDPGTRITWLDVAVHPAWRKQGIGTVMLDHAEALARDAGRPIVQGGAMHLPAEGPRLDSPTGFGSIPREDPTARFLLKHGYTLEQVYRYSALYLPVVPATLDDHLAQAQARAGPEYRVHAWSGNAPVQWLDDVAAIFTRIATDVPAGDLEIDDDPWDAERVRKQDEDRAQAGRTGLTTVVEHVPSGRLVALNELAVPEDRSRPVEQGLTLVLTEHRGHRLGMVTKIANIRQLQAFSPASPFIITDNAEENRPMLNVNEAVGFVPIAYEGAWKKTML